MTDRRVYLRAPMIPGAVRENGPRVLMECAGEDCPCARGQPAHPPILMLFDPESGSYRQARARCTAYWAENTAGPAPGEICGRPATHQVADVTVCEHHYRRMRKWMNDRDQRDVATADATMQAVTRARIRIDREAADERARIHREEAEERARVKIEAARQDAELAREAARLQADLDRERIRAEEAARAELSVVYFVRRDSDGLIKIGTSRGLAKRLAQIKKDHGPLRLIATTGGSHQQETALHRKFAAMRAEGEWFRPELPLLDHVYALVKQRPLEAALGLPPIMERREIGKLIWKLRYGPAYEIRREEEAKKQRRAERRRQRRAAA